MQTDLVFNQRWWLSKKQVPGDSSTSSTDRRHRSSHRWRRRQQWSERIEIA